MSIYIAASADMPERQLEILGYRYQELQDQLANAVASHETLRETPRASERHLRQSQQHVEQVRRQLAALREVIGRAQEHDSLS